MQELDMSPLIQWRRDYKDDAPERHHARLGYMGAFVKATTLAAQQIPTINTAMDPDREEIVFKDYVDISIAASTPRGLVTPVIRDCHALSIADVGEKAAYLAAKVTFPLRSLLYAVLSFSLID